jgi:hypothetical protein
VVVYILYFWRIAISAIPVGWYFSLPKGRGIQIIVEWTNEWMHHFNWFSKHYYEIGKVDIHELNQSFIQMRLLRGVFRKRQWAAQIWSLSLLPNQRELLSLPVELRRQI